MRPLSVVLCALCACAPRVPVCELDDDCGADVSCVDGTCVANPIAAPDPTAPGDTPLPFDPLEPSALRDLDSSVPSDPDDETPPPTDPPAGPRSCQDVLDAEPGSVSGIYEINTLGGPREVECSMAGNVGLTLVHRFSFGDDCPDGLVDGAYGCTHDFLGDASTELSVPLDSYSEVRGSLRVVAYGSHDAFVNLLDDDLDDSYVDGASLTVGTGDSRTHVWTFAAGVGDQLAGVPGVRVSACPCQGGASPPSFVGAHFSCESPSDAATYDEEEEDFLFSVDLDDVLFDGAGLTGDCLSAPESGKDFIRTLPAATAEPLSLRLMSEGWLDDEEMFLTELELWVR